MKTEVPRVERHCCRARSFILVSDICCNDRNTKLGMNIMQRCTGSWSGKGKGKVHPRTGHEGPEGEQMYSSTLPSTSALDGGGWSRSRPGRFTPRKDPVRIVYEAGWAPGPVWTGAENLAPSPGFDHRTVQPVASRCTD